MDTGDFELVAQRREAAAHYLRGQKTKDNDEDEYHEHSDGQDALPEGVEA